MPVAPLLQVQVLHVLRTQKPLPRCLLLLYCRSGSCIYCVPRRHFPDACCSSIAGPGLAFIAYPEAIAQMPVAPLLRSWSCIYCVPRSYCPDACCSSIAGPGLAFIAYPIAIALMPVVPLLQVQVLHLLRTQKPLPRCLLFLYCRSWPCIYCVPRSHCPDACCSSIAGPGLAFIAYPEAIAQMPVVPLLQVQVLHLLRTQKPLPRCLLFLYCRSWPCIYCVPRSYCPDACCSSVVHFVFPDDDDAGVQFSGKHSA
ncbi:hypothetical protein DPMN_185435 [Dreissena polymorpha]|uniref:Uncharacterized protein n=1 Tax=Dreissena polymorpha TaxID=45954 RepID=A0A9D4I8Q3_DREPO|nr:hypothetical protein DPMN_185435 [Dreissena polymorpha]